jgi:hypothetical protein
MSLTESVEAYQGDKGIMMVKAHGIIWVRHCVERAKFHGKLVNYEVVGVILRPDKTTKPLFVFSAKKSLSPPEKVKCYRLTLYRPRSPLVHHPRPTCRSLA